MQSSVENFKSRIFECNDFETLTLDIFRFQAQHNNVYSRYLDLLGVNANDVKSINQIPFLPVEVFKTNDVVTGDFVPEAVFKSSGTSGSTNRSHHRVKSLDWYHTVSQRIFEDQFGSLKGTKWFGLLPGYLERGDSSLVEMTNHFMSASGSDTNFFLHDYQGFNELIESSEECVKVIGVTHALLDWLEGGFKPNNTNNLTIIETGGMKGHGDEPIRSEVHERIKSILPDANVHSEYGMTELLSQAYSTDGRFFEAPKWMRILIKDTADPMNELERGRTGRVQIIDLANIDSCSFISTSDLGRMEEVENSNRFEILGRFDHSEVRGCNLLSVN